MKSKYLITGGCGFIGSHLAETLVNKGVSIRILDNLTTGKRENAPQDAELIVGDVRDKKILKEAVEGIDGCFHLAAVASMTKSILHLSETHEVNLGGTVNLIESVVASGKKIPIVYASTSAVYGDTQELPTSERAESSPLSPYGLDKWCGERHLEIAWRLHGLSSFSFRLFNVYGPRQDPHSPYSGVISIFTKNMREGLPLTIYGDGKQKRDFIHVSDVVAYFVKAMECKERGPFLFNLSTGQALSILELATLLEKITGKKVGREHSEARSGDIAQSLGNAEAAVKFFGFKPQMTVEEGLNQLVGISCVESF